MLEFAFRMKTSASTSRRLEHVVALLQLIDQRRIESGCPELGGSIERQILHRELLHLEETVPESN